MNQGSIAQGQFPLTTTPFRVAIMQQSPTTIAPPKTLKLFLRWNE
jgi:hypothetical protein